jgi:MFS transporter, FHS family, L-fucose permease
MTRNYFIVALVFFIFFVISFLTNILGPLIPEIIIDFSVSLTMAALLPFSFFIAYGVMSIPSGMAVEKFKEKKVILFAFFISFTGALLFSLFPVFPIALVSLFFIGAGMAMLQVAINPLLRVSGGEENFAFNAVLAQLFFGIASFLSPKVFTYLVTNLDNYSNGSDKIIKIFKGMVPENLPWVSLYWIFALVSLVMVVIIFVIKFPRVELKEEEKAGAWDIHRDLFGKKTVILFFFGIFAYVGTEQGIANWISEFLSQYHGFDPRVEGANTVSLFWGLMTVGCILGLVLLKFLDSKIVLRLFSIAAIIALTAALFGGPEIALWAFPATGFFASVMWSIVFSLGLNSLDKHHGSLSGILITGIMGGAITPVIIGALGDLIGLRGGMTFLYITLGYILSISFWAKPLIRNKTFSRRSKK